ncbi:MAG: hypothetical protein ABW217_09605, partial [Polyangiaceae bacterium]
MRALVSSILTCALVGAAGCDLDQRQLSGPAPAGCEGAECAESDADDAMSSAGSGAGSAVGEGNGGAGGSAMGSGPPAVGGTPGAGGSEV